MEWWNGGIVEWCNDGMVELSCGEKNRTSMNSDTTFPDNKRGIVILQVGRSGDTTVAVEGTATIN